MFLKNCIFSIHKMDFFYKLLMVTMSLVALEEILVYLFSAKPVKIVFYVAKFRFFVKIAANTADAKLH